MIVEAVPHILRADLESFFASASLLPSTRNTGLSVPAKLSRSLLNTAFLGLEITIIKHRAEAASVKRRTAVGFTVFDFIKPTENVLSDILQFFLDPEASHGQGTLFIRALIKKVRPDLELGGQSATIGREALTYSIPKNRRRIDLLANLNDFLLGIETKKFSGEGLEQVQDYCQHLQNVAVGRPFCLIFLNQTGAEASSISPKLAADYKLNNQLKNWSWEQDIPVWLNECHSLCGSEKIRHFIDDFKGYIAQFLATNQNG